MEEERKFLEASSESPEGSCKGSMTLKELFSERVYL